MEALLECPSEVVSREALRRRLWPDGTFVDFEHSLNAAVRRLRLALGDEGDTPRFVETLHRRGYRLLCSVEEIRVGNGARPGRPRDSPVSVEPPEPFSEGLIEGTVTQLLSSIMALLMAEEAVLKALEAFTTELSSEPPSDFTARLDHQSERLTQAIRLSHAEGIRFAAFTLIRMLDKAGPELRQDTRAALQRVKDAIEASGLPH